MDMSMHEINTAAETITAAADPDANIIFGATINPELEGEIIITVIATGFDSSYFGSRATAKTPARPSLLTATEPSAAPVVEEDSQDQRDEPIEVNSDMQSINMDLDSGSTSGSDDFKDNTPMPNIWSMPDIDEEEESSTVHKVEPTPTAQNLEEELEKPSFLRRLKNRSTTEKGDKTDKDKK
jgi:cell division protein FtsZ